MPSANGICAGNLVEELKKQGNEVDVICYKNEKISSVYNGIYQIPKKNTVNRSLIKKVYTVFGFLFGSVKSSFDYRLVENYFNNLSAIDRKKNIDTVIAMFFPSEAVEALKKYKKTNPNISAVIYELDSVGDGVSGNTFIRKALVYSYKKWLRGIYASADKVIVMDSHREYWQKVFGKRYGYKLRVADLPLLIEREGSIVNEKISDKPSFIFAGEINSRYRSPDYLISVLKELEKRIDFEFSFYSKGDCEDKISELASGTDCIESKGYVSQERLDKEILKSDFLVNIGNSISNSVPSKLINYISYGKPIIHIALQKNDICKKYLEKYPLELVIDVTKPINNSCDEIIEFVGEFKGKKIEFDFLKNTFYMNNPLHSVAMIEQK